jgi:hypothetical protein
MPYSEAVPRRWGGGGQRREEGEGGPERGSG